MSLKNEQTLSMQTYTNSIAFYETKFRNLIFFKKRKFKDYDIITFLIKL